MASSGGGLLTARGAVVGGAGWCCFAFFVFAGLDGLTSTIRTVGRDSVNRKLLSLRPGARVSGALEGGVGAIATTLAA